MPANGWDLPDIFVYGQSQQFAQGKADCPCEILFSELKRTEGLAYCKIEL